jgi:DNA-binding GntR family transcriptional regulator
MFLTRKLDTICKIAQRIDYGDIMSISSMTKSLSSIPRQSLATAVADKLREQIFRGELKAGERLLQDALAEQFHVSKIPVREAFSHLAAEGLVKIVANHGAIVAAVESAEIEQMFETRAVLECFLLRHALPRLTDEDFQIADLSLAEYERLVQQEPDDAARWGEWNWEFHSLFYAHAQRPVAMAILKTLNPNCNRYSQMVLMLTGKIHHTTRTHRELLEVFRTRDEEQACRALWEHLMNASRTVTEFIRQHPN